MIGGEIGRKERKKGRKKEGNKKEKRRSQQNVRHFIVQFFLRKGEGRGEEDRMNNRNRKENERK